MKNNSKSENLELIKWLLENGCPVDDNICTTIVKLDNLKLLKYMLNNGYSCNEDTFAIAASNGNLEILDFLHKNKCRWNGKACSFAAICEKFDTLKWLHGMGVQWNNDIYKNVDNWIDYRIQRLISENKDISMLDYKRRINGTTNLLDEDELPVNMCVMLEWLRENGVCG